MQDSIEGMASLGANILTDEPTNLFFHVIEVIVHHKCIFFLIFKWFFTIILIQRNTLREGNQQFSK